MKTVIICDDNIEFCNLAEALLKKYEKIYEICIIKFYNGEQLLKFCRENKFDILFLDIELGKKNGLDIAKILKHINPKCLTIYISAYDNYYVDMVQAEPFRFVKKDASDIFKMEKEIHIVLSDAIRRIENKSLFSFIFDKKRYHVDLGKVKYFYSAGRTVHIVGVEEKPDYYYGKIDSLENELTKISDNFVRINKSYIVNLKYISVEGKNRISIDSIKISITHKYRDSFNEKYKEWWNENI